MKLLIFYKSGMFLYLKWENLPAKAGKNRGITALPKPLVAIGQLSCDCFRADNDQLNTKILF